MTGHRGLAATIVLLLSSSSAYSAPARLSASDQVALEACEQQATAGRSAAVQSCLKLVWSPNPAIRRRSSAALADVTNALRRPNDEAVILREPMPKTVVFKDACPGEGCTYGVWTARTRVLMYATPDGPSLGPLEAGERIAALGGENHVSPVKGRVVIPFAGYRVGEPVYRLNALGEGLSNVWLRGKVQHDPTWGGNCAPSDHCAGAFRFEQDRDSATWWVRVQRRNGQQGWVRGGGAFAGTDFLGGDEISLPDPFDSRPMPVPAPPSRGFLRFPLDCTGPETPCQSPYADGPYTTGTINSILDHDLRPNPQSGNLPYGEPVGDGEDRIVAFNGEQADGEVFDTNCLAGPIALRPSPGGPPLTNASGCANVPGYAAYDDHPGYDYRAARGTPVYAAAAGKVLNLKGARCYIGNMGSSCNAWGFVGIDHGNSYVSQYGHLSSILVEADQSVEQGSLIGYSGSTSPPETPVGPHLHFEVWKVVGGEYLLVDPYGWTGGGSDPLYSTAKAPPTLLWQPAHTVPAKAPVAMTAPTIAGTWYCRDGASSYRFEFQAEVLTGWWAWVTENRVPRWERWYSRPSGASESGSDLDRTTIKALTHDSLAFDWGSLAVRGCKRTPPAEDTPTARAAAAQAVSAEERPYLGRWLSQDGLQTVEFFPGHRCALGRKSRGSWTIRQDSASIYNGGKSAGCGGTGIYEPAGRDRLTFSLGMQDTPVIFARQ